MANPIPLAAGRPLRQITPLFGPHLHKGAPQTFDPNTMTAEALRLADLLEHSHRTALGGPLLLSDLVAVSMYFNCEVGVVQDTAAGHAMALLRGREAPEDSLVRAVVSARDKTATEIWLIHTHPVRESLEDHFGLDKTGPNCTMHQYQPLYQAVMDWAGTLIVYKVPPKPADGPPPNWKVKNKFAPSLVDRRPYLALRDDGFPKTFFIRTGAVVGYGPEVFTALAAGLKPPRPATAPPKAPPLVPNMAAPPGTVDLDPLEFMSFQ
jgi:hypothetical protein